MSDIFSAINSNYNALAVQLNRRMTNHLQLSSSYTWSHSLDYGQNASTFSDTNDLLVPGNLKQEYGNSIFNVPDRFVFTAIAESPWKVGGTLGYLANDWQLAPIYASQSGLPYSLVTAGTPPCLTLSTSTDPVTARLVVDVIAASVVRASLTRDTVMPMARMPVATPATAQLRAGLVDPNKAAENELAQLPNMTPTVVKGMLEKRPFKSAIELNKFLLDQKLTPEQVESQKRFGLTAESLRVSAKFPTTFTNHAMQVPQLLFLKVSNDIQLEADLVLVLAP